MEILRKKNTAIHNVMQIKYRKTKINTQYTDLMLVTFLVNQALNTVSPLKEKATKKQYCLYLP